MNYILPPIWLIVLIVGLPQLSETIYSPSLPRIASSLHVAPSDVEYTLTIFLFGFAMGTLFWGILSDRFGRKTCVLIGLAIFSLGCLGCYFGKSIEALMLSRFIQAFGGSIGSVLGQAICRDAYQGPLLGKAYSLIGSALAFFPAIGPFLGGIIVEYLGWRSLFIFLLCSALALLVIIFFRLPETHKAGKKNKVSVSKVALQLLKDKKVLGFGCLVAGCNGLSFSYFAEGPFYFMTGLSLSPSQYGLTFILLALSTMLGGLISKKLQANYSYLQILGYGLIIILMATLLLSFCSLIHSMTSLPNRTMVSITMMMLMGMMFGICMVTSNALAQALTEYKWCIGTASSLFGFFYYVLISFVTLGMGYLHNGSLVTMPLYFLSISLVMYFIDKIIIRNRFKLE